MLINQRAPRAHSSVEPGMARGCTAAVVRRAIYVAMLSEQNQQLVPLIPCGTTPGGGVKFYRLFPARPRTALFCYMCLFGYFCEAQGGLKVPQA